MSYYQMSIEDIENQKILQAMSDRTAYIYEYGSFGFDFSSTGASKYYILCAVIVENKAKLEATTNGEVGFSHNY